MTKSLLEIAKSEGLFLLEILFFFLTFRAVQRSVKPSLLLAVFFFFHLFLNPFFVSFPLSGLFSPASPSSTRKEGRYAVSVVLRLGSMAGGRLELARGSFCFFLDL